MASQSTTTEPNSSHALPNVTAEGESSSQCLVIQFEGVSPWNNADSLVSADTEDLVRRMRDTVVLPILFLTGGPANVINMAVFFRQGLRERINVCLFSLSLADFCYLLFNMILYGEQIQLQFTTRDRYGPTSRFLANHYLLGFYGFTWVSQILSAIIASERCFCILQPLRAHTVLSPSTTTAIIVVTGIVILTLYSIVNSRYNAVCVHDPVTGSDSWTVIPSQFYLQHQQLVDSLDAFVFGVGIPVVMMVVVMVTTVVTVVKLRQAAAWRAGTSSSSSSSPSGGVSARDLGVTVMLVYNSAFFIACVFPLALFRVVWLFIPDMRVGRRQHNLYFTFLWLLDMTSYINASFNILVYYTMGSRYRHTLRRMLGRVSKAADP